MSRVVCMFALRPLRFLRYFCLLASISEYNYLRPLWSFRQNNHCHMLSQSHHEVFTWSTALLIVTVFFTHHNTTFTPILVAERIGHKYHAKVWLRKLGPFTFRCGTDARVTRVRDAKTLFKFSAANTPKTDETTLRDQNFQNANLCWFRFSFFPITTLLYNVPSRGDWTSLFELFCTG